MSDHQPSTDPQLYRSVVEDQTELIVRWSSDGRRTFVNESYCRYFGLTHAEAMSSDFMPLVHPDDRAMVEAKVRSLSLENPVASGEHRVVRPDGRTGWNRWVDRALFDGEGRVIGYQSVGRDITERKQAEEELRNSREELRKLATRLESVREEERTAIAREIHDELGQVLTGLRLDIHWLKDKLPATGNGLGARLGSMTKLVDHALQEVRELATRLRPALLDDLGLEAAVEWQAEEFTRRTDIPVELELRVSELLPDRDRDTAVFRILQEALTNVARYAEATGVQIRLYIRDGDELRMTVRDNGHGISRDQVRSTTSLGLLGMRERAGALGGLVLVRPREEGGSEVSLSIPLDPESEVISS
jgi:PAS domain S-box-containing protein